MHSPSDTFVSKRDGWLVAVIWGAIALGVAGLLPALWASRAEPRAFWLVLAAISPLGIGPWVLYGTAYTIAANELLVRSGPFRWRVPFAEIRSVEPSQSPLSSPACSLDRLLIQYGSRRIMISPLDRAGFLRALSTRCPELRLDGERLSAGRATGNFAAT